MFLPVFTVRYVVSLSFTQNIRFLRRSLLADYILSAWFRIFIMRGFIP